MVTIGSLVGLYAQPTAATYGATKDATGLRDNLPETLGNSRLGLATARPQRPSPGKTTVPGSHRWEGGWI